MARIPFKRKQIAIDLVHAAALHCSVTPAACAYSDANTRKNMMKRKLAISVDTIEFSVLGEGLHLPGTTTAVLRDEEGEILSSYQNWVRISGKNPVHCLHVRTTDMGKTLRVSGSPYAFLYGQNVYTPSDVRDACQKALKVVSKRYDLKPSASQERWPARQIVLHRVDLAANFLLDSEEQVINVTHQLRRQLPEHDTTVYCYPTAVHWIPSKGREYSIRVYAKGIEMQRSDRVKKFLALQRLSEECKNILRVELQLRSEGLRKWKLDTAAAWSEGSPEELFRYYMKRLPLLDVTSGPITTEDIKNLPQRLRPVLAAHKANLDLNLLFGQRTLQRHRKAFRSRGIDLKCPNQASSRTPSLKQLISPSRVISDIPEWLKKAGLYPDD